MKKKLHLAKKCEKKILELTNQNPVRCLWWLRYKCWKYTQLRITGPFFYEYYLSG